MRKENIQRKYKAEKYNETGAAAFFFICYVGHCRLLDDVAAAAPHSLSLSSFSNFIFAPRKIQLRRICRETAATRQRQQTWSGFSAGSTKNPGILRVLRKKIFEISFWVFALQIVEDWAGTGSWSPVALAKRCRGQKVLLVINRHRQCSVSVWLVGATLESSRKQRECLILLERLRTSQRRTKKKNKTRKSHQGFKTNKL